MFPGYAPENKVSISLVLYAAYTDYFLYLRWITLVCNHIWDELSKWFNTNFLSGTIMVSFLKVLRIHPISHLNFIANLATFTWKMYHYSCKCPDLVWTISGFVIPAGQVYLIGSELVVNSVLHPIIRLKTFQY